ncbi:MAG: hypothetical protein CTY28_10340 [Hyphomicrobium sp.]|nr:MAG: hypothetical protein CTY28_10340 [Hyphomicrobium sp.]
MKLLTIDQVADQLMMRPRTVRRLEIPYAKVGRKRLYDPRDVEAYVEGAKQCPSSSVPVRLTTTRKSSTEGLGLSAALRLAPAGRRKPSTENTKSRSLQKLESPSGQV